MTAKKEKPIIYTGQSVLEILAGRKGVTRRVMKPQPWLCANARLPEVDHVYGWHKKGPPAAEEHTDHRDGMVIWRPADPATQTGEMMGRHCRHGAPGDRLWVRESFWQACSYPMTLPCGSLSEHRDTRGRLVHFSADGNPPNTPNRHYPNGLQGGAFSAPNPYASWEHRPSIHMPRWASRIDLTIINVRAERLHAITADEVVKEGLMVPDVDYSVPERPDVLDAEREGFARGKFRELWDAINGKREGAAWALNPWVWRIEFERVAEVTA